MRVYLPATLPLLASWRASGEVPAGIAHAVTPALREWYREGDIEELEYVATVAAGRASLRLLASDGAAPPRRVVVAVEVADAAVSALPATDDRSQVRLTISVPRAAWAAVLVDDEGAAEVVSAAVAALPAADAGDDDAEFALDEADAAELSWWAVQELNELL